MKTLTLILFLTVPLLAQDTSKVYLYSRLPDGTMKLVAVPKIWLSGENFQPQATATVDTSAGHIATKTDLQGYATTAANGAKRDTSSMTGRAADSIAVLRTAINGKQATLIRGTGAIVFTTLGNGATAMDFANNSCVKVTPTATATYTTTVPIGGLESKLIILTTGTTSRTITFGTGFKSTGTLATGTVSGKIFVLHFVSDGTQLIEEGRTTAQ